MSIPKWFNEGEYLQNKLAWLQRHNVLTPEGNYYETLLEVAAAFEAAGITALDHYNTCGTFEDLAPSSVFKVEYYCESKLAQLQKDPATKAEWAGKGWLDVQLAIHRSGMSLGQHYSLFGAIEGVSFSSDFDTTAYLTAKLSKLRAAESTKVEWATKNTTDLAKALQDAGMDPYTHYLTYRGDADEVAAEATFPAGGSDVTGQALTTGLDTLIGTAADDTFSGRERTVNSGDYIDGGEGTDTLRLSAPQQTDLTGLNSMTLKSVEILRLESLNFSLDTSSLTGIQEVWLEKTAGTNITINAEQKLGFEGQLNTNQTVKVVGKTASLSLKDIGSGGNITFDTALDTLNLSLMGEKTLSDAANFMFKDIKTLNISGDGSLKTAIIMSNAPLHDATLKTLDASGAKGDLDLDLRGEPALGQKGPLVKNATVTLGAGNDRLEINYSGSLTLDGGAGDKDTLVINAPTMDATFMSLMQNVKGFETLVLDIPTPMMAGKATIAANKCQDINEFILNGSGGLTGADAIHDGSHGSAGLNLLGIESADSFSIGVSLTGGSCSRPGPGATPGDPPVTNVLSHGGTGGAGLSVAGASASTKVHVKLTGNSNLAGGSGGDGDSTTANGGAGGAGLHLGSNVGALTIDSTGTSHRITSGQGGNGSGNGNGGDSYAIVNTGVSNITITGDADLTIQPSGMGIAGSGGSGTHGTSSSFSAAVVLNASGFFGKLTTGGSASGDTITVGSGGSEISGTKGNDTVTFGRGADSFNVLNSSSFSGDTPTDMTTVKNFASADSLDFGPSAKRWVSTAVTVASGTTLEDAIRANDGDIGTIKWFTLGGNTYVMLAGNNTNSVTGDDYVVKLEGSHDLASAYFNSGEITLY